MKVYISGPIGGRPDGNRPAFAAAADVVRRAGHEPVNPHDIDGEHPGLECAQGKPSHLPDDPHRYGCYLVGDIVALARCDAILMLADWADSPGARAEYAFAEALGLTVFVLDSDNEMAVAA